MYLAPCVLHNFSQLHVKEVSKLLNVFHSFLTGKELCFHMKAVMALGKGLCSSIVHQFLPKDTVTIPTTVVVSYSTAAS